MSLLPAPKMKCGDGLGTPHGGDVSWASAVALAQLHFASRLSPMGAQKDAHQGTRGEGGDFWVGIRMQSGLARTTVNKQCIPPRAGRGSMGLEELNGRKNWVCLQ
ncbi:hypothetical protein CPAR01_09806 [Colletotrichum paranaense]|uniref:Uncharacterized protein n=1 Tax=Colletotrichum paranaense TaxID=1914294 RepID=A0ABQ9SJ07_9PEZI|nr:uncharacterized protein CPAR01_09806 [Colletotrichum paranaense]KAK1536264.1 hypothetical protein CPAR01_09806 [Colletotrichum paranaense]